MRGAAVAAVLALAAPGCAGTPSTAHRERIAEARRGLEGEASVEARTEEVEAALARERGEAALDDFQAELEQLALPFDPDFVDDVFAAHEMGDQLVKQKQPKESDVHKKGGDKDDGGKKGGEKKGKTEEAGEVPIEPNAEYWQTLQEMGFSESVSK